MGHIPVLVPEISRDEDRLTFDLWGLGHLNGRIQNAHAPGSTGKAPSSLSFLRRKLNIKRKAQLIECHSGANSDDEELVAELGTVWSARSLRQEKQDAHSGTCDPTSATDSRTRSRPCQLFSA